jgi:hypothetical protein
MAVLASSQTLRLRATHGNCCRREEMHRRSPGNLDGQKLVLILPSSGNDLRGMLHRQAVIRKRCQCITLAIIPK